MHASSFAVAAALLATPVPRCGPAFLCMDPDDDAALEEFLSEPHPRITAEDVSVSVSAAERGSGTLNDATLDELQRKFSEYGVVRLCGAWGAQPALVDDLVSALDSNYEECVALLTARTGLTADDSFGYRQIVHRSSGRYDLLLEEDVAPRPLSRELRDAVLGTDGAANASATKVDEEEQGDQSQWRRQVLARLLGDDFKVEFTAALLARKGCAVQDPHADGAHPREVDADAGAPSLPPHAVQLFLPLCDMDASAGPTEFWPTSQRREFAPFASLLPPLTLEARAGDAIFFDFRVVHRGTANTARRWRPILYQTCTTAWFIDDFNFPASSLLDGTPGADDHGATRWQQDDAAPQPRVGGRRRVGGFM